jgi:hypothetical protein
MLIAGLGLYGFVLVPGILPHSIDIIVTILSAMIIASVAIFGFDNPKVEKGVASLMIAVSLIMLVAGISVARAGHDYVLFLLSVPATGLGLFGARKFFVKREKHE